MSNSLQLLGIDLLTMFSFALYCSFKVLELDLGSFASVKKFAKELKTVSKKPLDRLVCNAAVYQPALQTVSE